MPNEEISPLTGEPYPTLSVPLRALLGQSLPTVADLSELCTHGGSIPVLLDEIVRGTERLIAEGRPPSDVRTVGFRHVRELQEWFPGAVRSVVGAFNGHPQFDRIYSAIEEFRICADVLCKLTYDRIREPQDKGVIARSAGAAVVIPGVVDDLCSLAGLRPIEPETDHGKGKKRKHRPDSGGKLKADAKKEIVTGFIKEKCGGHWDGTYEQLSEKLRKELGLKISDSQLYRYLKGTRYVHPQRAPRRPLPGRGETEPVVDEGAADMRGCETYTMPDEDDETAEPVS